MIEPTRVKELLEKYYACADTEALSRFLTSMPDAAGADFQEAVAIERSRAARTGVPDDIREEVRARADDYFALVGDAILESLETAQPVPAVEQRPRRNREEVEAEIAGRYEAEIA